MITCKICEQSFEGTQYRVREMMFGRREEFTYIQCPSCHCLQLLDPPADMSQYYPENYYSFKTDPSKKFKGIKGFFRRWAVSGALGTGLFNALGRVLFPLKSYRFLRDLKSTKETSILDVGCGNGSKFLYPLAEDGYRNLLGCDPFLDEDIFYENGLEIRKAEISEIDGLWDIITFHHSFEHISQPQQALESVKSLLKENGICVIRIPTASSWAWEHYRENWVQIDAPRHYFLHSRDSMDLMARNVGLELFDVIYDSWHLQFTGSEWYKRDIPLRSDIAKKDRKKLAQRLKRYSYKKRAKKLNRESLGDQAIFFFRKSQENK